MFDSIERGGLWSVLQVNMLLFSTTRLCSCSMETLDPGAVIYSMDTLIIEQGGVVWICLIDWDSFM